MSKSESDKVVYLYIGNMLQMHGFAPTSIDLLGSWLSEHYPMVRVSSYKNQLIRFIDMFMSVIKYRKSCRLILIDTYSGKAFWYALIVAKLARIFNVKYIPILHGGRLPDRFHNNRLLSKRFIDKAAAIVTPSRYLEQDVLNRGWGKPICIPNAIDLKWYDFKIRTHVRPYLLWVRSFHEIYNPLMALDVLKELVLRNGLNDAKLCMVGGDRDGTMKIFRDRAIEYGLLDRVEITDSLSKAQWIEKSKYFDIFLNTTNFDNTPVSVIEAMALGLPVISTKVGGIAYLIDDGIDGLLIDKGDVHGMVEAIRSLIDNSSQTQELSSRARKKIENFSWDKIIVQWQKLLGEYA